MIHQKYGYIVEPFRISKESNLKDALKNIDDSFKYILVAGGDGTVDSLVNCMKSLKIDLPIGILPVGTANDFAKAIGISRNIKKACEQILNSEPIPRSEEHTSELQSRQYLVCRLLLEKKKANQYLIFHN